MKRVDQAAPQRHGGNGQPKIDGKWFTRASSLAKVLEDQGGLINWKAKMAAKGIASSPQLLREAQLADLDDYRWRNLVEQACEAAGASDAADLGTSIHEATEQLDYGNTDLDLPDEVVADATAYRHVCAEYELEPLAAEVFVANKELRTAGSFDRIVRAPDGRNLVLDIKTISPKRDAESAARFTGLAWSIQISTYANALPYDADEGYLDWQHIGVDAPDTTLGYVAAIPRGTGKCFLIDIDLEAGYRFAHLAALVRDARRAKPATPRLPQQELNTKEGS